VSETLGMDEIGESDKRDDLEDPSVAGSPEVDASPEDAEVGADEPPAPAEQSGRLDEREQRQHGIQQHGDTFAVDSDEPTDTSGINQRGELT